jgi:hypothetical protein
MAMCFFFTGRTLGFALLCRSHRQFAHVILDMKAHFGLIYYLIERESAGDIFIEEVPQRCCMKGVDYSCS